MKVITLNTIITTVALFYSFTTMEVDKDTCKVNKYSGKYIFWMSEPLAEYEEVFSVKTIANPCQLQSWQSEAVVKEAIVQSSLSKIEFDAVIVGSTERDIAIKFKETTSDKSLGRVKRINGIPVFIDCTPVKNYAQIKRVKRFRRYGDVCFTSVKTAEFITRRKAQSDALIIGDDFYHWWIKFN